MNKAELKAVLKPLIKECIKEVMFEDSLGEKREANKHFDLKGIVLGGALWGNEA